MKRRVLALSIVMSILITLLPSAPAEEYEAAEKVGTELLELMNVTYSELVSGDFVDSGETYSCIIWIEDVEIETAVEAGIEAAEMAVEQETEINTYASSYTTYELEGLSYVDVTIDDNASDEYVQTYIEAEREAASELYADNNNSFVAENFMARDMSVTYVSKYSPCVFADLTVSKVAELVQSNDVFQIEHWSEKEIENCGGEIYLSASDIAYGMTCMGINSAKSSYNVTGNTVKIGQIEKSCPEAENVVISPSAYISTVNRVHANTVYEIMYTVAENATYYATSHTVITNMCEQIEWLLAQGVNIINMSAGDTSNVNTYTAWARWIDHIAINHNVHFVQAAGNNMDDLLLNGVISPGMAYNVITVGNVTTAYGRYVSSSYNDNGVSRTEERTYKPDIMAIGTFGDDSTENGTSYSAPFVAGTIALMCEYRTSLKTKPFVVKAILAAATMEKSHNYVTTDEDFGKYGAGILYAKNALDLISNGTYTTVTGSLSSTVTTKTYNMTVSSGETNKRIALTYGNTIKFSGSNHALDSLSSVTIAELGIAIYSPDGDYITGLVTDIGQFGANLKVIEFNPQSYGAGTYTIKVIRVNKPSDDNVTYFGVAWK